MKTARAVLASPSWRSRHSSLWATLLVVAACGSSAPPTTGGRVTSVTVAGPASVTSGLRFRLTATVQGAASNTGVAWTVVGGGAFEDPMANPVVYVAPSVIAVSTIHIQATAAADRSRSGSIDVEVRPAPALVPHLDPSLLPAQSTLPDGHGAPRVVAASKDAQGVQTDFIVGEVRIHPQSQSDLQAFLQRYGGTVIGDDHVPDAPASLGITLTDAQRQPTEYLVRIDLSRVDPAAFPSDGAKVGVGGEVTLSSQDGLLSLAAVANASAHDFTVAPNWIDHPSQSGAFPRTLLATREQAYGGIFDDALFVPKYFPYFSTGSHSNVALAWQFVAAHGIRRRASVAIIDGGFWLFPDGTPRGADSDLPRSIPQYDFTDDDAFADGPNPAQCTDGSPCQWHGHGSTGTAVGAIDNQLGAAGSGGLVADPMLLKIDLSRNQLTRAIRTAVGWGADIVNMSFGGDCNVWCRQWDRLVDPFAEAVNAGSTALFVASAGNGKGNVGYDVGDPHFFHPCIETHVFCVGALGDGATTAQPYSNTGGAVAIFAPTNIPVMTRPAAGDSNPGGPPTSYPHGGTSAAAPVVSGVAAMMKALNPALTGDDLSTMLKASAHHGLQPVALYLDALGAVRLAAEGVPGSQDAFEPNNSLQTATQIPPGTYNDLSFQTDGDHDLFLLGVGTSSRVTVTLDSPSLLGTVWVGEGYGLEAVQLGCGELAEESDTTAPARLDGGPDLVGHRKLVYRVPAGTYLLDLSGKVNAYDLGWSAATLPGTSVLPDAFEPNNDLAHAVDVGLGLHGTATLTAGDVDVFRVQSQGSISSQYLTSETGFFVNQTDVPVSLTLYDQNGQPIGSPVLGAQDCQDVVGFRALPAGTYYVTVTSRAPAAVGTYRFFGGVSAKGGTGPIHDRVYDWVRTGDPVDGNLRTRFDGYIFTLDPATDGVALSSNSPLHLRWLDVQGNVLGDGQTMPARQGWTYGEQLRFGGPNSGSETLLEVSRALTQSDTVPPSIAGVGYALSWSSHGPTRETGNLILNGDAEDPNQAKGSGEVVDLRLWTRPAGSNLTVVRYGTSGFMGATDPGPPDRGEGFFAGGPDNASSSADQLIDLEGSFSSWFTVIDAGQATFHLSGWLGGFSSQTDSASLTVTFQDSAGQPTGTIFLPEAGPGERNNVTGTLLRQADGLVPARTRRIAVHLEMTRREGSYNDGYADSFSLNLQDWTP